MVWARLRKFVISSTTFPFIFPIACIKIAGSTSRRSYFAAIVELIRATVVGYEAAAS